MATQFEIEKITTSIVFGAQRYLKPFPQEFCLITGPPRSGTSALNTWLGRQRSVVAFHESRILLSVNRFIEEAFRFENLESDREKIEKLAHNLVYDYYLNSSILFNKKLLVEKEPLEPIAIPSKDYLQFMVNTRKIFPNIKFIFLLRDPIATIWSMSRRTWGESLTMPEARRFSLKEYAENWCACVDIALEFSADANTYQLQFGNLINDSNKESKKVFDFLKLRKGIPFKPRSTSKIGFSKEEKEEILEMVQSHLKKLELQGITNL